jgi:hypothetical protein
MIFFRIGSYLLLTTGLFHMIGQLQGMTAQNETEKQLLDLMTNYVMHIGSEPITMMDMFTGFDWFFTLLLFWSGALSLILSYKLKGYPEVLKTVSLVNLVSLALGVALSVRYFFSIPTICLSLCFVAFGLATWKLSSKIS